MVSPESYDRIQKGKKLILFSSYRMRILVWQLSVRKVSMTSSGDDALSLSYPACVARDSMHFLSSVSLDSLIAHGPGMVCLSPFLVSCLKAD